MNLEVKKDEFARDADIQAMRVVDTITEMHKCFAEAIVDAYNKKEIDGSDLVWRTGQFKSMTDLMYLSNFSLPNTSRPTFKTIGELERAVVLMNEEISLFDEFARRFDTIKGRLKEDPLGFQGDDKFENFLNSFATINRKKIEFMKRVGLEIPTKEGGRFYPTDAVSEPLVDSNNPHSASLALPPTIKKLPPTLGGG